MGLPNNDVPFNKIRPEKTPILLIFINKIYKNNVLKKILDNVLNTFFITS